MELYDFTPIPALSGGIMIGLAAILLMALNGRIAGISGILGGLLPPESARETSWRLAFVIGLVCGGFAFILATGNIPEVEITASVPVLVIAGLLVGYGTRMGSGCTSGHGVCGIGRLSPRGITSTVIYIGVAAVTVFIIRHVPNSMFGG